MERRFYQELSAAGIAGDSLPAEIYKKILTGKEIQLLPLLDAAFQVRRHFHGLEVAIHIINNVRNGLCPEDCSYCAQSKSSRAEIAAYTTKSDDEIIAEAEQAYEDGAYRYCMVYAGRSLNKKGAEHIAGLVRTIKEKYSLQVCVSAGIMDEESAKTLRRAGLDRLNHNLNTSASRYAEVCTTHSYEDRVKTLRAARRAGLEVCSGIIAGLGESAEELVELATTLRDLAARSIPINFLLPIKGNVLSEPQNLSPEFCLRILCLFRFVNPRAEIRVAAGRERHLRGLEVLSLYPANSLFMDGYLNTRGRGRQRTLQMIDDAGFTIRSDKSLAELLQKEQEKEGGGAVGEREADALKLLEELRPYMR